MPTGIRPFCAQTNNQMIHTVVVGVHGVLVGLHRHTIGRKFLQIHADSDQYVQIPTE